MKMKYLGFRTKLNVNTYCNILNIVIDTQNEILGTKMLDNSSGSEISCIIACYVNYVAIPYNYKHVMLLMLLNNL